MPHKPVSSKLDHSHVEKDHDHDHGHEEELEQCDINFEEYIEILQKPEINRTQRDLKKLFEIIQNVKFFFQNQVNTYEKFAHILKRLQYSYFKEDDCLMRKGDLGDKFYIILHGVIDVWIPAQNENIPISEKDKITLQLKYNMIKFTKIG